MNNGLSWNEAMTGTIRDIDRLVVKLLASRNPLDWWMARKLALQSETLRRRRKAVLDEMARDAQRFGEYT